MATAISIGQRFTQLIQQLGLSKNAFALSLDKTATVIQHLVDERNKPGYDLICKVFEVYPNVSKDWLLLGQGPMLLNGNAVPAATAAVATPLVEVSSTITPASPTQPSPLFAPAATTPSTPEASASAPVAAAEPIATPQPFAAASSEPAVLVAVSAPAEPAFATPSTAFAPTPPAAPTSPEAAYITAALHAQHLQHQLALAEQRNQHLLEQQQLMQQMLDLMRRTV